MNTPKTVPHTPTPWHIQPIGSRRYIEAQGPKFICDMQRDEFSTEQEIYESDANAAHIVLCVNSHGRLISVVRQMVELWDNDGDHGFPLYDEAKAALAALQPPPDHE